MEYAEVPVSREIRYLQKQKRDFFLTSKCVCFEKEDTWERQKCIFVKKKDMWDMFFWIEMRIHKRHMESADVRTAREKSSSAFKRNAKSDKKIYVI